MNRANARRLLSSYLEAPAVRVLTGLGLSPNAVTLLGLLIAGISAFLASRGYLLAGGAALLVSGVFDMLDGSVARATDRVTRYGGLVDSVTDRVAESLVLLGLLLFYLFDADRSSPVGALLVYLALAGSVMVSYVRARAEGLGIECKVGIMTRPERIAALGTGLILGQWWEPALILVLGAVAALSILTSAQRVLHVLRAIKAEDAGS